MKDLGDGVVTRIDLQSEGLFKYGGRDAAADALFPSGDCAIIHASSGLRGRIVREARFAWGEAMLPYWPDVPYAPLNSIIGGASFWVIRESIFAGPTSADQPGSGGMWGANSFTRG